MQRHGGTYVPRDTIKHVSHPEPGCVLHLDHEMLLAMSDRLCLLQPKELNPWMWVFRRNCLMSKVQAKAIRTRLAHHSRQNQRGPLIIQVRHLGGVPSVPKHTRP